MLPSFQALVDRTIDQIASQLNQCESPYVSFSGGKDSAVLLHLVRLVDPKIPARCLLWGKESDLLADYDFIFKKWGRVETVTLNRDTLSESTKHRWASLDGDSDAVFMGLREEESKGRKLTLRVHGHTYKRKDGQWRFCPLGRWKTAEITAYTASRNLPILPAYETLGMDARTSTRIPRASVREQALADLARHNPKGLVALRARFPELCSDHSK